MTARAFSLRSAAAVVVAAAALALMARASAAPLAFHVSSASHLRLSWSARPERIEVCRTLSAEELAQRAEHMRQRVECEGHFATYALRVTVDGQPAGDLVVQGAGLRHDRPLYLLHEFEVPAGTHAIGVSFTRREKTDDDAAAFAEAVAPAADTGLYAGRAQREATEHARRARAAIPARLALDTTITFAPRQVKIITFDAERRGLQLLSEADPAPAPRAAAARPD